VRSNKRANVPEMDEEQVEFRAGRDSFGQALWVAGLIVDRERRADGPWVKVLPVYSGSDEDARWVPDADVRHSAGQTH
jgi:hypothetical protein